MIKEKYETKNITKQVLVSEKRYCDICGEEITGPHWEVKTGHHDWGRDSVDSIEGKDICSVPCLRETLEEYYMKSNVGEGHFNTQYIKIEHYQTANVKGEINND